MPYPSFECVQTLDIIRFDFCIRQGYAEFLLGEHDKSHNAHTVKPGFQKIRVVAKSSGVFMVNEFGEDEVFKFFFQWIEMVKD